MPKRNRFFEEESTAMSDWDQMLNDIDISLVTNSFNSKTSPPNPSKSVSEQLRGERSLEENSISRMSKDLTSIPSRYLRYSETEVSSVNSQSFFITESTINESDLLSSDEVKEPVPVIEVSNCISYNDSMEMKNDSLSVTTIYELISDHTLTPHQLVDYFTNKKSPLRKSSCFGDMSEEKKSHSPSAVLNGKNGDNSEDNLKEIRDTTNLKKNLYRNYAEESSISTGGSSALSPTPNGKLPIGTTKTEIIWGCVQPGKTSSQDFLIKNRSSSPVRIKCSITNPSFRLIMDGSECTNSLKVILFPFESQWLTAVFAPISEGAVFDNIDFVSLDTHHSQITKQFIRLFGYGGHAHITLNNVFRDSTGKFVLPLGNIIENGMMTKIFRIGNVGSLPSFAYIRFVPKVLNLFTSVKVSQETIVLLPNEETQVAITCEIKEQELKYIQSKRNSYVINIGKMTLIHGTEVDRGRLRRLCLKPKAKGLAVEPPMQSLVAKFPGEIMPNDLKHLKEATASRDEIIRLFHNKEVIVTIEQDLDSTRVEQFPKETASFVSLCENTVLQF